MKMNNMVYMGYQQLMIIRVILLMCDKEVIEV